QTMRVTTDRLGQGQTETIDVNGNTFTYTGPLTAQQLAAAMAADVGPLVGVSVQDMHAHGFTITSDVAGTAFTATITGSAPTPATLATVQANVPISANQTDIISLSGPVGTIGEVFSITISDPPNHGGPVTISYRTTGDEADLNEIADKLISKINNHL